MSDIYNSFNGLYTPDELKIVRTYLQKELKRSLKALGGREEPRAYHLAYLFRNNRYEKITGRLGGINEHSVQSENNTYCDVRVGSYRYDNVIDGGLAEEGKDDLFDLSYMPSELKEHSFRYSIWKLTDESYRTAVEEYYDRKAREIHFLNPNRKIPARVKPVAVKHWKPRQFTEVDTDYWKYLIRKGGEEIAKNSKITNSWFEFINRQRQSIYIGSGGQEILQQSEICELRTLFWLQNKKGEMISYEINLIEGASSLLPSETEFLRLIREKIKLLHQIETAPRLNSYSGPVLLSPVAAGLFFHEVIGHRLEGSRLLSPEEGATFMDLRGRRIAPEFVDIVDNPTIDRYNGRQMIGHYRYDDEGMESKKVTLVSRGILKNFLTGASPVPGQSALNGHARNQTFERPISRMGNLFVMNRSPVSEKQMKQRFLEEIKRQKKPFGIFVKETLGGETGTSSYDFQAFKGEIMHAVKVYPDGKEEIVRGVDFVGTPLSALESVICMGDTMELDNAYCGAESGMIPVSTIAPSTLMRNLELQSKDRERLAPHSIPRPLKKTYNNGKKNDQ